LTEKSKAMTGTEQWPYRAVTQASVVISWTSIQDRGASAIRLLTSLQAKHTGELWDLDVNGETGSLVDMKELGMCCRHFFKPNLGFLSSPHNFYYLK
jgi:T-complex protein 1 subunit gamma